MIGLQLQTTKWVYHKKEILFYGKCITEIHDVIYCGRLVHTYVHTVNEGYKQRINAKTLYSKINVEHGFIYGRRTSHLIVQLLC